jgi:hypothetical protein
MLFRGMDKAALDAAYNIQAAMGPDALPRFVADWQARTAQVLANGDAALDLRYGPEPRQRLDFFRAGDGRPTLAFIHGGYWQRQDKETYRFIAEGPLARGVNFANIEYTLAPDRTMDGIVAEIARALTWLDANLTQPDGAPGLYLAGHSAGGHLCATAIGAPGVRGGVAISGIFDLEPIRLGSLNDKIGMDEPAARRNSPILHLPATTAPPLTIAFGEKELPELCRQSRDYHAAWIGHGLEGTLMPLAGHDHFSILDELAKPDGAILAAICEMIGRHTQA